MTNLQEQAMLFLVESDALYSIKQERQFSQSGNLKTITVNCRGALSRKTKAMVPLFMSAALNMLVQSSHRRYGIGEGTRNNIEKAELVQVVKMCIFGLKLLEAKLTTGIFPKA